MKRALALFALLSSACGYHAAYGGGAGERVAVVLVRAAVADSVAAGEVASGVRETLARDGALAGGSGYPRVEVEVTRIDEASDGIAAANVGGTRVPQARATEVGVVARAWLVRTSGGEHERDTGDVRALVDEGVTLVGQATPSADSTAIDSLHHDDAVRAAARKTGILLAQRILGLPAPEVDVLDETGPTGR